MSAIEGVEVEVDIFVSSIGFFNIFNSSYVEKMKNNAFVGNFGHCNRKINPSGLEDLEGMKVDNIEPSRIGLHVCTVWVTPNIKSRPPEKFMDVRDVTVVDV